MGSGWRRDWDAALRHAVEAFNALDISGLKTYRALWAFLASEFVAAQEPTSGSSQDLKRTELIEEAHLLTARATWLREIAAETRGVYQPNGLDTEAASMVAKLATTALASKPRRGKKLNTMLENLASTQTTRYATGLAVLGELLGAESFKPAGKGRTDAVWAWEALWLTLEAKSEQKANGLLSMEYVRQANTQQRTLAADRAAAIPDGSVTIVISRRQAVDSDAAIAAEDHIYLTDPKALLSIVLDAKRALAKASDEGVQRCTNCSRRCGRLLGVSTPTRDFLVMHASAES